MVKHVTIFRNRVSKDYWLTGPQASISGMVYCPILGKTLKMAWATVLMLDLKAAMFSH